MEEKCWRRGERGKAGEERRRMKIRKGTICEGGKKLTEERKWKEMEEEDKSKVRR